MKTRYLLVVMLLALVVLTSMALTERVRARSGAPAIAPAAVTAFQDGVAPTAGYAGTRDTMIKQGDPAANFGSNATLASDGVDELGQNKWALIKWDVSAIPSGSVVQSASVTLNVTDNGTSGTYHFYEVTGGWNEGTVTWNTRPGRWCRSG